MGIKNASIKNLDELYELEKNTFSEADAATRESIERRIIAHKNTYWILKSKGKIISAINGITTNEKDLVDEMYAGEEYYDKKGKWLMIFGVSTLPEYQHKGFASKLMREVLKEVYDCKLDGAVLTCKEEMISFYEQFGFVDEGESTSKHGGSKWHQMRIHRKEIKLDIKREIRDTVITLAAAAVLAFVLGHFVILNCTVPSGSMLETIQIGDDIIGNRLAYKFSNPKRGDIAIFLWPDDETQVYIKRIIGLPGETLEIKGGKIYINGSETPLEEDYLSEDAKLDTRDFGPYEIPEDCYFMLGDNRQNSADARLWENTYVSRDKILAKAEFVYYPFSEITWLGSGADY
jgi:signal peptidase I